MIRLQFVLGAGLPSRLIAWYGNGYAGYSHVDGILSTGELLGARSDEVGGKPPGVQVRPKDYEQWKRRCVVEIPSTDGEAFQWEKYLRSQVGKQYDKGSILGFIFGEDWHDKGHWICSALQIEALEVIGKVGDIPTPPNQITPNSLLIAATAIGGIAKAS